MTAPVYRTNRRCTPGGVEAALLSNGYVAVRSTKDPDREPLVFDRQEWADFVAGVKNGDFDFLPASELK